MYELEVYEHGHYNLIATDTDLERLIANNRTLIHDEQCRLIKIIAVLNVPKIKDIMN